MAQQWECNVCGYVHLGDKPPESCPVCGATASEFKPVSQAPSSADATPVERWECAVCGYIHEGPKPPEECPLCGADDKQFRPLGAVAAPPAAGRSARIVIIGAGIAGLSAAEAARTSSPDSTIILLSSDTEPPYYRLNLTRYLAGEVARSELAVHPADWYAQHRIDLRLNTLATGFDLNGRFVDLASGERVAFDKLILTNGAHPFVPPITGSELPGVISVRSIQDAERLLALAQPGKRCLCIGGGLLGLETAGALARCGVLVSVLESHGHLMPSQLDASAGKLLGRHLRTLSIDLCTAVHAKAIVGQDRVQGVALEEGQTLPADIVVFATGVRSTSHLARQAALEVKRGVVVDSHLVTSHPDVLAAGDVAEHMGMVYGNWAVAQMQGRAAGMNAVGVTAEFAGVPRSHTLKVLGLDTFSIGQFDPADGGDRRFSDASDGRYLSFIFREGCLIGANLVGDTSLAAVVRAAVESRRSFAGLLARQPAAMDVAAYLSNNAQ